MMDTRPKPPPPRDSEPEPAGLPQPQATAGEPIAIGDNDTALNRLFSSATIKLKKMLGNIPLRPFRIHLNEPKGIDDVREDQGNKFASWYHRRLDEAILLDHEDRDMLAFRLFEMEAAFIPGLSSEQRLKALQRLAKLAAQMRAEVRSEISKLVKTYKIASLGDFRAAIAEAGQESGEFGQDFISGQTRKACTETFFDGKNCYLKAADGRSFVKVCNRQDMIAHLSDTASSTCRSNSACFWASVQPIRSWV